MSTSPMAEPRKPTSKPIPEPISIQHLTVNSVHWCSINPQKMPSWAMVSAESISDPSLSPKSKTDDQPIMDPEPSVEGFESTFGAPTLGVQWHPEAYNPDDPEDKNTGNHPGKQVSLIRYMQKAGAAYVAKKTMLNELRNMCQLSRSTDCSS